MITGDYLRSNFTYDPETGLFKRLSDGFSPKKPDPSNGYFRIRIEGKLYYVHRLIWMYQTGSFPDGEIEHQDRNRANNKWANLLDVPKHINALNKSKLRSNTSGVTGVYWEARTNKWRAEVRCGGNVYRLGRYHAIEHAADACRKKRLELGFSHTHGDGPPRERGETDSPHFELEL